MHECRQSILYLGDCMDELDKIQNNSIDCIITSPPYNFSMNYDEYNDNKDFKEYFSWLKRVFQKCYLKLKSGGRLIINIQPLYSSYIPTHAILVTDMLDIGFLWKAEILWEKNNYNMAYTAWGSWKSPSSPYFKYTWEFIEVFCKDSYKHEGASDKITITADEFKEWVYAKWSIAPEHDMQKYNHPAMFPEQLSNRLIKLFTFKDDVVLDPFMGVGTTGVSAMKLDRNFLGIEISEQYFNSAKNRIQEARRYVKNKLF